MVNNGRTSILVILHNLFFTICEMCSYTVGGVNHTESCEVFHHINSASSLRKTCHVFVKYFMLLVTVSVYFKVIITDDGFCKEVETFDYLFIIFT